MSSRKLYEKLKSVYPKLTGESKKRADKLIRYRDEDFYGAMPRTAKQKRVVQRILDSQSAENTSS